MPRKRKRDWPQKVYKYRAYPQGDLPLAMWNIAQAQQRLWNDLVALWHGARHEAAQLITPGIIEQASNEVAVEVDEPDAVGWLEQEARSTLWSYRDKYVSERGAERRNLLSQVLKRARELAYKRDNSSYRTSTWKRFDEWANAAVKQSGLNWEHGPDVLDRFRAATRSGRRPSFHGRLDRVSISHRFTSGGLDIARLVDGRGRRVGLVSSADWQPTRVVHSPGNRHWRGRFQFGEDLLDFALALHRPLPAGAIVKRVTWLGTRNGLRWFWYIAITVEQPPAKASALPPRPCAGMDVGWRLFGDGTKHDYLRVAMVADSEGRMFEIRLPLNLRPGRIVESRGFHTMSEWQAAADACKDRVKSMLATVDFPADLQHLKFALPRMGRQGLQRIYNIFLERGLYTQQTGIILALLTAYDSFYNRRATLSFRLRQRRGWYYRNLARWLCWRYVRIAIEDMSLSKLRRRNGDDAALKNAARYRDYAALAELRAALKAVAAETGTIIVEHAAVDSTVTCWLCGVKTDASKSLKLCCPNGHEWDQDKNAARNLLSQTDGTFGQPHMLRKSEPTGLWQEPEIPSTIAAILLEVPA